MAAMVEGIEGRPALLLQHLIRFDTSNPPGREAECVDAVEDLLRASGVKTARYENAPGRPNLIARLPGRGEAPGLLFYGHLDVVPAGTGWTYPPFEGRIADGCVWGRGALDMKGGVAMMLAAFLRAARENPPPGDVVLALFADEESGGTHGAKYVVDRHPEVFRGVRYAIGEFGGFPLRIRGRVFYPIQVAEKAPVVIELVVRGAAGHGARPMRGGAMAKAGGILRRLDGHRTPIHITDVTRRMVEALADHLTRVDGLFVRRLLHPASTDRLLARLGAPGRDLEPLFRNTVNATVIRGGDRSNVVPSEIHIGLDGRVLPGFSPEDLMAEIEPAFHGDAEARIVSGETAGTDVDLGLFDLLGRLLVSQESGAVAIPYILPGSSDGRHLARLGIQTYGYTPMNLPPDVPFFETIHACDERVPVAAVDFGTEILHSLIRVGAAVAT